MKYTSGYKYKLEETVDIHVPFSYFSGPHKDISTPFITFSYSEGILTIKKGYAWNGASGPVPDTPSVMFASLVHDAWYQLIREEEVQLYTRGVADEWFGTLCKEDGLPWWIASIYEAFLLKFGEKYALKKPVIIEVRR